MRVIESLKSVYVLMLETTPTRRSGKALSSRSGRDMPQHDGFFSFVCISREYRSRMRALAVMHTGALIVLLYGGMDGQPLNLVGWTLP
jgi:hypothetical protein